MPSATQLSGTWSGDDGAVYYLRGLPDGTVTWAGLHDSGFHRGIAFTNVFRGSLSADGTTLNGQWADVPRGQALGSGTLSLAVVHEPPSPPAHPAPFVRLRRRTAGTTGAFGASVLTSRSPLLGPFPLAPHDVVGVIHQVHRYDGSLGDNNPPYRDFTVLWGTVSNVSRPTLPPNPTDYCSFATDDGWDGDGDYDFDLTPDWSRAQRDFWTSGWVTAEVLGRELSGNVHMLQAFDQFGVFHCEAPMYGRKNDEDHCRDAPVFLIPGWFELGGNNVLVNGRPSHALHDAVDAQSRPALRFDFDAAGKHGLTLASDVVVRVTGVVADDPGHGDLVKPEIHPVYSLDIVQDFHRARLPTATTDLTGAWHGDDVGTYYVRQTGHTVWWLGLSCDQGRTFATVFHGTVAGGEIRGDAVDVPMGVSGRAKSGSLTLLGGATSTELLRISGGFGATAWTKLYDVGPTAPIVARPS